MQPRKAARLQLLQFTYAPPVASLSLSNGSLAVITIVTNAGIESVRDPIGLSDVFSFSFLPDSVVMNIKRLVMTSLTRDHAVCRFSPTKY